MSDFWQTYEEYEDERIRTEANQRHYRKVISDLETQLNADFLNITPAQANAYYEAIKVGNLALTTKNERLRIVKSIGLYMEAKFQAIAPHLRICGHIPIRVFCVHQKYRPWRIYLQLWPLRKQEGRCGNLWPCP